MILFKRSADLRNWLDIKQKKGKKTGFVPTMGALHEGHMQLINAARSRLIVSVCSIFVNPAQFNDPGTSRNTRSALRKISKCCTSQGRTCFFLPAVAEIYPDGDKDLETYDLGSLENVLEGRFRPGHFQGVCQVMSRLLKIDQP